MKGLYDIHTHIIPHVDDGADTIEITKKILQMEYNDGVRTIFATSHFRRRMFETPMEKIRQQYLQVQQAAKEIAPDLRLILGCEFHANLDMVETLNAGKRPTMGDTRFVLTEFSEVHDFRFIQERCYELISNGYEPIIAHAERYPVIRKNLEHLEQLVDMGAYVQMNADSISGVEGWGMKRFCKKVMKQNLLHFVGSDAHNTGDRKPQMGRCAQYMEKTMGREYADKILIRNPREIIEEGR